MGRHSTCPHLRPRRGSPGSERISPRVSAGSKRVIAVTTRIPLAHDDRPPIVLVHGAANSATVWTYWQEALASAGWPSYAIDLRGHGASSPVDLSNTSMNEYAADILSLIAQLRQRPILVGWSMGGLVAMMAAAAGGATACV